MNIDELNAAYGLDLGGHTFEEPPDVLAGTVVWESPDSDYVPWISDHAKGLRSIYTYAFAPEDASYEWPPRFSGPGCGGEHQFFRLVGHGLLEETDRECCCHGRLAPWTGAKGAKGEAREPLDEALEASWVAEGKATYVEGHSPSNALRSWWQITGNPLDQPHPQCERCEGDGIVVSTGGAWALYEEVDAVEILADMEKQDLKYAALAKEFDDQAQRLADTLARCDLVMNDRTDLIRHVEALLEEARQARRWSASCPCCGSPFQGGSHDEGCAWPPIEALL